MSNTPMMATCDLCDAHKNDDSGAFRVLPPVFRDFGAVRRFVGPVVTVKCFEDNSLVKAAVESAVQVVGRWILASLRHRVFDTVADVVFTPTRTIEVSGPHKPTVGCARPASVA